MAYSACGTPTALNIINNGNNTITVSCKVGANGTDNTAAWVQLFITCDGTEPSQNNYKYTYTVSGAAGSVVAQTISFAGMTETMVKNIFGSAYSNTVKFTAITKGTAGVNYDSQPAISISKIFTWRGNTTAPVIVHPKSLGEITGLRSSYRVTWYAGQSGINNSVLRYTIKVRDITTGSDVITYSSTNPYCDILVSDLVTDHSYRFYVTTVGSYSGFNSPTVESGILTVKTISKFSNLDITVSDGNTVPSTDITGNKTYIDIGSGTVLKLSWNTPQALNNAVDHYVLDINSTDPSTGASYTLYLGSVGNINEFYLNSNLLENARSTYYQVNINITACSKYGSSYDGVSGTLKAYISKGCGTYLNVNNENGDIIAKRAIAFARLKYLQLVDVDRKAIKDANGKAIYVKASRVQDVSNGWTIMQEFNSKDLTGAWKLSDIKYEALTDASGELITDVNNSNIYTL